MKARTFRQLANEYDRLVGLATYVGGGVGGLGLLGAGDLGNSLFGDVPTWIASLFVTSAIAAGACAALAYSGVRWAKLELDQYLADNATGEHAIDEDSLLESRSDLPAQPIRAHNCLRAAVLLVVFSGLWLIVAVW
jgi:hypothetical protein